jgi:hypothetical protein
MTIAQAHETLREEMAGERAHVDALWLTCVVRAQLEARHEAERHFSEIVPARAG